MTDRLRRGSRAALLAVSDGGALAMLGCLAAMLLTLAATLSRSGFVALVAAAVVGASLGRRDRTRGLWVGMAAAAALLTSVEWVRRQREARVRRQHPERSLELRFSKRRGLAAHQSDSGRDAPSSTLRRRIRIVGRRIRPRNGETDRRPKRGRQHFLR